MTRTFRALRTVLILAVMIVAVPLAVARADEGAVGPNYVHLTPISFSVIGDDDKIDMEVSIALALELKNGVKEAVLDPYTLKIQDALLISLTQLWDSHPVKGPPISSTEIKQTLMPVVTAITGPGKVAEILILGIGERLRN